MTLGGFCPVPASVAKGSLNLIEEVVLSNTEADQRQSKNDVAFQSDVVVPQGIGNDILCMEMMDSVDFEDDSELPPIHV